MANPGEAALPRTARPSRTAENHSTEPGLPLKPWNPVEPVRRRWLGLRRGRSEEPAAAEVGVLEPEAPEENGTRE